MGKYQKGRIETSEEKEKRLLRIKELSHLRKNYIGDIKNHKLYNIWRSIKFTQKGKKAGCSPEWNDYRTFYNDVISFYEPNKRFVRIDKTLPFSLDNCCFLTDEENSNYRYNSILLEYKNEIRTLKEWAYILNLSLHGIRNRYHKYINIWTTEEILFGKKKIVKRKGTIQKENIRASKLCSTYRIRDKNRRRENNINSEWFLLNISNSKCYYCGDTFNIGLDRIDNNKGHTVDNVLPCCVECNIIRSDRFTVEEMIEIGKTIKIIKEKRFINIIDETQHV